MTALFKAPNGVWHRVTVVVKGPRTATIEYFDNRRRTALWRMGRRYSVATRRQVEVPLRDLKDLRGDNGL